MSRLSVHLQRQCVSQRVYAASLFIAAIVKIRFGDIRRRFTLPSFAGPGIFPFLSISSSLIMGVFFKFGTSPLYQSQVLFLSFNFMCISSQKIFGKCTTKGVKGQGVKYDPPKGVKISKWSKLNSDCRFGFLSKK